MRERRFTAFAAGSRGHPALRLAAIHGVPVARPAASSSVLTRALNEEQRAATGALAPPVCSRSRRLEYCWRPMPGDPAVACPAWGLRDWRS